MATELEAKAKLLELESKRKALIASAEAKYNSFNGADIPEESSKEINKFLGDADIITAEIKMFGRIADGTKEEDPNPSIAQTSWRKAGPDEGNAPHDAKSWHELEVKTAFGNRTIRYHVPLAVSKDAKHAKAYGDAFESYMRKSTLEPLGQYDAKTLSEGVDSSGGFFIPEDYHAEILKKTMGMTAVRPNARVVPTSRDMVRWPRINYTTDNIYTSPVRLTWTGEIPASATTHRVTEAVAGIFQIPVNTAMASVPITNDLIEDSAFDLQGIYTDLLSEAFALGEDNVFLNGTGGSMPLGMLQNVDVTGTGITSVTGTDSSTHKITGADIIAMFYKVPAQYRKNLMWLVNSNTMQAIEGIQDQQLRYLIQSLTNSSLQNAQFELLKNKPVAVDEFMPDVNGAGTLPIISGDMKGYLIVDRVGLSVQKIDQLYAELNQTLLLARRRLGGQLVEPYKMRVLKIA